MVTQHAQAAMLRFNNLWPEMNLYHLVVSIPIIFLDTGILLRNIESGSDFLFFV